jgi:uncharacterized protein (DUF305 family)
LVIDPLRVPRLPGHEYAGFATGGTVCHITKRAWKGYDKMASRKNFVRCALLVACAVMGWSLFAAQAPAQAATVQPPTMQTTAQFERAFMEQMSDHHFGAVSMAQLCLQRTTHFDVYMLCQSIESSQSQEISQMKGWLSSWYKVSYTAKLDAMGTMMMQDISPYHGQNFDKVFLEVMIHHHDMVFSMASNCLVRALHTSLLQMCQSIISSQSMEILVMRGWLCQWYSVCDALPYQQ